VAAPGLAGDLVPVPGLSLHARLVFVIRAPVPVAMRPG